jgi:putative NADPH-quinone reductase
MMAAKGGFMSDKRILLIVGHPDPKGGHLCQALAQAYADGAAEAGHALRRIDVAQFDFPLLRSADEWERGALPATLKPAQDDIEWAQHMVLFFPLWLGDMPALLKGFLEQVARPGFAFHDDGNGGFGKKGLSGRSARVVVTMGMPALVYRYYFRAHSLRSLERNVLGFVGIAPVHETLIGMVDRMQANECERWFTRLRTLGRKAA